MQNERVLEIQSGVNEGRFIAHLREMFSSSTKVLTEAMQNSRRACATKVIFDYDPQSGSLSVMDDGHGIEDFTKLIVIAESGWNDDVMSSEDPFGIGAFSIAFACKSVTFASKGKQITFSSDDLIQKNPIQVVTSYFIGGTKITMKEINLDGPKIRSSLEAAACGFGIPVFFNGYELQRPDALDQLENVYSTEVGQISIPYMVGETDIHFYTRGQAYCQGLPVKAGHFSTYGRKYPIVHINHNVFKPRVPDRDALIDEENASKQIIAAIEKIWIDYLHQQKSILSADEFSTRFWRVAKDLKCSEIMNDVPHIPLAALSVLVEAPYSYDGNNSCYSFAKTGISRQQVESGEKKLCTPEIEELEGDGYARAIFAMEKEWVFVENLHSDHWANSYIIDLEKADLKIVATAAKQEYFQGRWVSGQVKVVDKLSIVLNGEVANTNEPLCLGIDNWSCTMIIPRFCDYASLVLRQASSYIDEHDQFQGLENDLDSQDFDNLVAILKGEDPCKTVEKCLNDAGVKSKTNLRDLTFLVSFDSEGNFTVGNVEVVKT